MLSLPYPYPYPYEMSYVLPTAGSVGGCIVSPVTWQMSNASLYGMLLAGL